MTEKQYDGLLAYMRACASGASHGEDHVMRVTNAALEIAASEPAADREVLLCACLLHDVGRPEQQADPSRHHAAVGAEKARAWLVQNGWDERFAARVAEIIASHSSAALAAARGIEARILFDADKLDVIGAIGLIRTVVYGVEAGEPLYDEADLAGHSTGGGTILREAVNDLNFALSSFMTPRGKALAAEKARLSQAFIESMKSEIRRGQRFPSLSEALTILP